MSRQNKENGVDNGQNSEDNDEDFFDTPRGKNEKMNSQEKNQASHKSSLENSVTKPPPHPQSYKSDKNYPSDNEDDEHLLASKTESSNTRRVIEATLPAVQSDPGDSYESDYTDDYDDDDDDDDDDHDRSGRKAPVPPSERRQHDHTEKGNHSSGGSMKKATEQNSKTDTVSKRKIEKGENLDQEFENEIAEDTDSDVTDVSPLNTPKLAGKKRCQIKSPVHGQNSDSNITKILDYDKDSIDLKMLLQTVLEMENDMSASRQGQPTKKTDTDISGFVGSRKNYSFTNDRVRMIDRENQRLMEKIMSYAREAKKNKQQIKSNAKLKATPVKIHRPTSAAINRSRQQMKIEAENLALLQRLQQTQASKELQRHHLMSGQTDCRTLSGSHPSRNSLHSRSASSFGSNGSDGTLVKRNVRPQSAYTGKQPCKKSDDIPVKRRPQSAVLASKKMSEDEFN